MSVWVGHSCPTILTLPFEPATRESRDSRPFKRDGWVCPPHAMHHRPVVNCAYGYQKETQQEAGEVEEGSAEEEETGQEEAGKKEGAGEQNSEQKSHHHREKGIGAQEKSAAQKRTILSRDLPAGNFGPGFGRSIGRRARIVQSRRCGFRECERTDRRGERVRG